jgi:hypothetical protein
MVAFIPMSWNCPEIDKHLPPLNVSYCPSFWNPHGACAVALFVCLALVSLFCAHETLPAIDNRKLLRIFKIAYYITGSLMVLSPIVAAVLRILFNRLDSTTYFIELTGVMSFAIYWLVKSEELHYTKLDQMTLDVPDKLMTSQQVNPADGHYPRLMHAVENITAKSTPKNDVLVTA